MFWGVLGCAGVCWDVLGCSGVFWGSLGCSGVCWGGRFLCYHYGGGARVEIMQSGY